MQEQNVNNANKSQIVIRLNLIKGAKGWEIPDFARAIGVSNNKAANYLSGRTPLPSKYLPILSDVHDIDTNWLLTGEGYMYKLQSLSEPGINYGYAKAGHSSVSQPFSEKLSLFSGIVTNLPEAELQIFIVEGSSMERTLSHGDYLLCKKDRIEDVIDGRVYVLEIKDHEMSDYRPSGIWVKRCFHRKSNGYITCKSDNIDTTEPFSTFRKESIKVKSVWYPILRITGQLYDPNRDIYNRLDELESRIEMLEEDRELR